MSHDDARQQDGWKPIDARDGEHLATIVLTCRPDGGLRIHSTDRIGLILSGRDPVKVLSDVWPALVAIATKD